MVRDVLQHQSPYSQTLANDIIDFAQSGVKSLRGGGIRGTRLVLAVLPIVRFEKFLDPIAAQI